jgi:hypothetical protein
MRLPDDLRQQLCAWFQATYDAAYKEEHDWWVQMLLTDFMRIPNARTLDESRQMATDLIDEQPGRVPNRLLANGDSLELAIIEALLESHGVVREWFMQSGQIFRWVKLTSQKDDDVQPQESISADQVTDEDTMPPSVCPIDLDKLPPGTYQAFQIGSQS